jgi:probable HAF family extracellular repeat protein
MRTCFLAILLPALAISVGPTHAQTINGNGQKIPSGIQFRNIDYPDSVTTTGAYGINPGGDIVGMYATSDGVSHSFVTSRGVFKTLDLSGAFPGATIQRTWLERIAPGGDTVVGTVVTEGVCNGCFSFMFQGVYHGVVWDKGHVTKIHFPNAAYTTAYGRNPQGDVVGEYAIAGLGHGYRLSAGVFTTIHVPGAQWSSALGINSKGDIVGWYTNYADMAHQFHGYVLRGGTFTTIDAPGASWTIPYDINSEGEVVGMYIAADGVHGFLWREGKLSTVDVPGAVATQIYGINERGDMVGWYTTNGLDSHGVLFPK